MNNGEKESSIPPVLHNPSEKIYMETTPLLSEIIESSNPQENHSYEYEPQDDEQISQLSHSFNPSSSLEADEEELVDLSDSLTLPCENYYLYEKPNLTTDCRSELVSSEIQPISSATLTEGDNPLNNSQIIPKSLDVGKEEVVGDEGADEDLDIIGDGVVGEGEISVNVGECVSNSEGVQEEGECGVGDAEEENEQYDEDLTTILEDEDSILPHRSSKDYEEVNDSEEGNLNDILVGQFVIEEIEGPVIQKLSEQHQVSSENVLDSPHHLNNSDTLIMKDEKQSPTMISGKRKLTDLDYFSEEEPLWKRSRLEPLNYEEEQQPFNVPLSESFNDSVVIFVNDIEEELDDNELDLGLCEEISSF